MKWRYIITVITILWLSGISHVAANSSEVLLKQANQCREIAPRLERLACFDQLFSTPIDTAEPVKMTFHSSQWNHAMDSQNKVTPDRGWLLSFEEQENGNAWVAMPAQNSELDAATRPVLLLSCINNISRVELALPSEVVHSRIRVSMRDTTQYWRSDDDGVLFSSGRGIPAIEMMKSMMRDSYLTLRSNAEFADGLRFDTRNLDQGLALLRERCGW